MVQTERRYLIIASDRSCRVTSGKRYPSLKIDEVAVTLNIKFPDGWGKVLGQVDITVPDIMPEVLTVV